MSFCKSFFIYTHTHTHASTIIYIKGKFCLSGLYRLGNYINFVGALNQAVVGFESTHLDGCDLLV